MTAAPGPSTPAASPNILGVPLDMDHVTKAIAGAAAVSWLLGPAGVVTVGGISLGASEIAALGAYAAAKGL